MYVFTKTAFFPFKSSVKKEEFLYFPVQRSLFVLFTYAGEYIFFSLKLRCRLTPYGSVPLSNTKERMLGKRSFNLQATLILRAF